MNKYLKTKEGSLEDLAKQMQNKVIESDYQDKFKKELDKAGKPIGHMTGAEKKAFFNKIDKMHTAKNEQAKNPYAIGMAAAMKAKDDKPPLKKSTITKAHDIAKSIEKDQKEDYTKKDVDKFHTKLDKLVHKSFGHSSDEKKKEMKEDFFVNDKKDTLKKFSGRIGYNKGTLTDYLAKKTGKNKDDVYFDDTELVYKDKTVLRNAETKTVDQMLQALRKEEVHPHVKKMVKDGESDEKIKKMHPELKDDELEKLKETHMSTAKAQNQKQKEVGGEKEPIKTSKNEWKTFAMMAAELREKKEEKKEQEAGEDTRDPKEKTMTGKVATSPEMNPRVDYKY